MTRRSFATAAPRRWRSVLASWVSWIAIAGLAWVIWPANLGGQTSYVVVSGESMTPEYQPGDLLIAREGEVEVGDVVVYAPAEHGGAQIVHRVIGGDETGWEVRGDANDFTDPFTPAGDEVVGVVQIHVPGTGPFIRLFMSPWLWLSAILISAGAMLWPSRDDEGLLDEPAPEEAEPDFVPELEPALAEPVRSL